MKELWKEMSWYRRGLFVAMIAMILFFGIATVLTVGKEGLSYQDALLLYSREGELIHYTGRVKGQEARFTLSPWGQVDYRWGDQTFGPYIVETDPTLPVDFGQDGTVIRSEDEVLFRGYCVPFSDDHLMLIEEGGSPADHITITAGSFGEKEEYDPEPSLSAVARVALGVELTHRGDIGLYLLITLLALLNLVQICWPDLMFRMSLWGRVRNVDSAEPSEFYLMMEHIEWAFLAVLCLVLYWEVLTTLF